VHSYSSGGEGPYSLKPLSEPIQICLHPLGGAHGGAQVGEGEGGGAAVLQLSIDPLVRMRELQLHLLRTSAVSDTAYEAFGTRLLGCVVDERPLGGAADAPLRRATVTALRTATPLRLSLHTLRYDAPAAVAGESGGGGGGGGEAAAAKGGEEAEVVLATREYRIVGRVPDGELSRLRGLSTAAAAGTVADPEARVHTVSVLCPEGLPVELFLDNVMSEVRRALRQAESGAAPMTRSVGEDYGWRDRGWERGGSQFERSLTERLREHGVGAVARRQTSCEAEVLMARLQNTVMALSAVETPEEEDEEADEADEAVERWTLLARVQGLVAAESAAEQAQWVSATVVDTAGSGPQCSLVYDDGHFEAGVPAYRVRPVPMVELHKRVNPLAVIFMSFEQFLSSREERRPDTDAAGRESVPANLRRTLSAFHIGRVQQVGHVSRERISNADTGGGDDDDEVDLMDTSGDGDGGDGEHANAAVAEAAAAAAAMAAPSAVAAAELPAFDIAPMPLQVRFALGPASGAPAEAAAPSLTFDDEWTLLHSLQRLREAAAAQGLEAAALAPQELGFHPGVTCDRTGQVTLSLALTLTLTLPRARARARVLTLTLTLPSARSWATATSSPRRTTTCARPSSPRWARRRPPPTRACHRRASASPRGAAQRCGTCGTLSRWPTAAAVVARAVARVRAAARAAARATARAAAPPRPAARAAAAAAARCRGRAGRLRMGCSRAASGRRRCCASCAAPPPPRAARARHDSARRRRDCSLTAAVAAPAVERSRRCRS